MNVVQQTEEFEEWLEELADQRAREIVADRIVQLEGGLLGNAKSLGGKVSEIKISYGPGYRLYFSKIGVTIFVLLCGGDKGSQRRDIKKAKAMAAQL